MWQVWNICGRYHVERNCGRGEFKDQRIVAVCQDKVTAEVVLQLMNQQ